MITHTVFFKLKFPDGSEEEALFFSAAKNLTQIPGVKFFQCVKQLSKKNNYDFGLIMQFDHQKVFDAYNAHPEHTAFIQEHWLTNVMEFIEIDYETF